MWIREPSCHSDPWLVCCLPGWTMLKIFFAYVLKYVYYVFAGSWTEGTRYYTPLSFPIPKADNGALGWLGKYNHFVSIIDLQEPQQFPTTSHNTSLKFSLIPEESHCRQSSTRRWFCVFTVKVLVNQSCPTLCNPMDYSPPGSSAHGILQASIQKWVVIPFSRGSSQPRDWTRVSHIVGIFFTIWATRKTTIPDLQASYCSY